MLDKLEAIYARYCQVEELLSSPEIASDMKKFAKLNKEYSDLKEIVESYHAYRTLLKSMDEAQQILAGNEDDELKSMARDELEELQDKKTLLDQEIKLMLIPKEPEDNKNAIIEIRAGTGGDEASLFAGDLFRMYQRFAQEKGFQFEVDDFMEGSVGGFSRVIFHVNGPDAYGVFKFESGVHRVQRVPETESQGRVHTSAATVAVLPEADDVDVQIDNKDIKKDTYRSSGAGGQHVNKTESAVRLTHLPTGIVVECQEGRSQIKNYEKALSILRSRIYEKELEKKQLEVAAQRKSLVSTGDRSAKIRTYNFPQGRVTDHRINVSLYNLQEVLNGDLQEFMDALKMAENMEKMKAGGLV
jgi:peptide chain release factor 1